MNKILSLIMSAMLAFFSAGCEADTNANQNSAQESLPTEKKPQQTAQSYDQKTLEASFADVGQGDCEFIKLPNGQCILIDSGNPGNEEKISELIHSKGCDSIDYFIMTHPHADHIGSAAHIIKNFDIKKIYMPKKSHTSKTFENVLDAVSEKGYSINTAKAGVNLVKEEGLEVDFIAPVSENYDDLNNYSAVLKIKYKNNSFLFMGDAEKLSENEILNKYSGSLKADVIKIGHHGSSTSSSETFIKEVSPKYAVISCGKDNSYSHPHIETISLLNKLGINIYRTDECGTITITSDGDNITVDKKASSSLPNAPPQNMAESGSNSNNSNNSNSNSSNNNNNTAAGQNSGKAQGSIGTGAAAAAGVAAGIAASSSQTPKPTYTPKPQKSAPQSTAPQVSSTPQSSVNSEEKNTAVVYKTRTGECYHRDGCSSLRKSKFQTTVSQAKAEGLRPCKNCKPPQ